MKSKSKKMSKSTLAIIIMAFVMVAMVAFGATYAYFTATATAKSTTVKTGTVKLDATYDGTSFEANRTVFPGDYLIGAKSGNAMTVKVTTDDPNGNYVAVKISITGTKNDEASTPLTLDDLTKETTTIASLLGDKWTAVGSDGVFVYTEGGATAKAVDNTTGANLVVIGAGVIFDATDNWTQGATYSDAGLMGATINISVQAKSIQASNVTGDNAAIAALMFS